MHFLPSYATTTPGPKCYKKPARAAPLPAAAAARHHAQRCIPRVGSATSDHHQTASAHSGVEGDPLVALRHWVTAAGGYVDPRLTVSSHAPTSHCRGVVNTAPITLKDLQTHGPLISVPQHLQFTASTATHIISAAAGPAAAATAAEQLTDTQLIAAALAHELHRQADSFWGPYLTSLPEQPPNPWLLNTPAEVEAALQPIFAQFEGGMSTAMSQWVAATAAARQQQQQAAAAVEALLAADLGISHDDVMVAMGHVTSRSLVSGSSSGMCPVIDLINHHDAAAAPMLQLDDQDQLVMTVLPVYQGEAVELAAGAELLIAYKGGYTPLEAFLKFGFVAQEWWGQQ